MVCEVLLYRGLRFFVWIKWSISPYDRKPEPPYTQIPHQIEQFQVEPENHTSTGTWRATAFHRTTGGIATGIGKGKRPSVETDPEVYSVLTIVSTSNIQEIAWRLTQRNAGFDKHIDCSVDFGDSGVRQDSGVELDVPRTMNVLKKRNTWRMTRRRE